MDLHHILIAAAEAVNEAQQAAATEAGGPLGTLGINWKSFIGQLFNFGVVLFIFWRWIVKPLGQTLMARQEKIESGLKNAAYMEDEKKKFEDWKTQQMQNTRSEAEKVLKNASEAADKIKRETISQAQSQANKLVEQAKSAVENEKTLMLKEVRSNVADLVVTATEKILKAKLDSKKDHELVSAMMKETE